MGTQLRLLVPSPPAEPAPASAATPGASVAPGRPRRTGGTRGPVLRISDRRRRAGRRGVEEARRTLEAATLLEAG